MEIFITKILTTLVLPPGIHIVAGAAGLALLGRRQRLGAGLLLLSLATLYLFSAGAVSGFLLRNLETYPALDPGAPDTQGAGAIVVLGGGRHPHAAEYGADTVDSRSLARARYAARLHRQTHLPVLVSGGAVLDDEAVPESLLITETLTDEFNVPVAWTEEESRNTAENALYTRAALTRAGIERVLLVTHASHMARAVDAFERAGLTVVPAPTGFNGAAAGRASLFDWLPSAGALGESAAALHEYLGRFWYRLRY